METSQGMGQEDSVSKLLAILAHELRMPLGNIRNSVKIIELDPKDTNAVLDCAQIMQRQISRIARLIDDLFDISVIDQGKMSLNREVFSANSIMRLAVEDIACEMETKNHNLKMTFLENDVNVHIDQTRFLQVLCNLLGNAAKYTEPGGKIHFTSYLEEDCVVFSIRDNGIGIEQSALSTVFNIFSQELRAAGKLGLGIGLALVKKLVELHDGDVTASSQGPGQGAIFSVRLPIHQEPSSGSSDDSKRVLLVEDDKVTAQTLKKIIEVQGGHSVRCANTGRDAIDEAIKFKPEVVLMDLSLPDMSGEIVARIIRRRFPSATIMALTGYSEAETDDWFDHYMVKPVDLPLLFRLISSTPAAVA